MTFVFAGHELDIERQELRRDGERVHVEPQVFDLLALLVAKRDRIVSKDEILETIWDGRIVSDAALSSRVNAVRRAVGDRGTEQAFVKTFHKRGFRFVADVTEIGAIEPEVAAIATETASEDPDRSEKTSVAVLPFENLSRDEDSDYFAYGLTEDVIRLLGRNRWLTVLTRHATYSFGSAAIDAREVGAALGVRYLVEGSVRKVGDRVRITAGLIAADDGRQLWSENYDLAIADIFDIQDAMAKQIAAVIEPELASIEQEIAARKKPQHLAAWDLYQRGLYHLWGFTRPAFVEAERCFRRAIEIEPGLARAHAALSYVHLQKAFYGEPEQRPALLRSATETALAAVGLDERDSLCHCVLGRAYCLERRYDDAIATLEKTIELNPSFAQGYFALAFTLVWSGRQDEAIALLETAAELSPRDPHLWTFHHTQALAYLALGEVETAEFFARQACRHPNATHWPFATLASILGRMGKTSDAHEARDQLLDRRADYTLDLARQDLFFCSDASFIDAFLDGLRLAGVPR